MNYWKKLIILVMAVLTISVPASGKLKDLLEGEFSNVNIIFNPGFEFGISGWTASGGTLARESTEVGLGTTSASFDAAGAGNTLTSRQVPIPKSLYGKQCQADFAQKGGDSNLTAEVIDGALSVQNSLALAVESSFEKKTIVFVCPSSGTLAFRINSSADAAIVYLDNIFLGMRWVEAMVDPMTTRGDLITRDSGNLTERIPVGAANTVLQSDGTDPSWATVGSSQITNDTIVDADVNSSAAIAYSKLNLSTSIIDADVNASAAIAGSKLQAAGDANAGAVTTLAQTFAGIKTFTSEMKYTAGSEGNFTGTPPVSWERTTSSVPYYGYCVRHVGVSTGANFVVATADPTAAGANSSFAIYVKIVAGSLEGSGGHYVAEYMFTINELGALGVFGGRSGNGTWTMDSGSNTLPTASWSGAGSNRSARLLNGGSTGQVWMVETMFVDADGILNSFSCAD